MQALRGVDFELAAGTITALIGPNGAGKTSDIGPHWLQDAFVRWPGYATLWRNTRAWLTGAA